MDNKSGHRGLHIMMYVMISYDQKGCSQSLLHQGVHISCDKT